MDFAVPTFVHPNKLTCMCLMLYNYRFILDALMESMDSSVIALPPPPVGPEGEPPVEMTMKEGFCTSHTYRIISLIAFLVNQAPAKAAFLTVTRPGYE